MDGEGCGIAGFRGEKDKSVEMRVLKKKMKGGGEGVRIIKKKGVCENVKMSVLRFGGWGGGC